MSKHPSKTIIVSSDTHIYVDSYGDDDNEPVLLLHGAGNSRLNWPEAFCDALSKEGLRVIRMDSRDAGNSQRFPLGEPGYGLMDLVDDVVGVLDDLGIAKINLVGVSQGAAVTQLFAIHHPDRVKTICLISATPGGPGHTAAGLPGMTSEIAAIFSDSNPSQPDWTNRDSVVDYLVEAERPFAGSAFDEQLTRENAEKTFDTTTDLVHQLTNPYLIDAGTPWRDRLKDITVPALVVHGSEDPLFPLEHGKVLAEELPNGKLLVLEGVGHANIPKSQWSTLIKYIRELVKAPRN